MKNLEVLARVQSHRSYMESLRRRRGACEAFVLAPFRRCNREAVEHTGTGRRCRACHADDKSTIQRLHERTSNAT